MRTLAGLPPVRRDLIRRHLYLVPNSLVVTRGCPHHCDFCYKDAFFEGGKGFYVQAVDDALAEIERLPGRHLYFLDDHLLGNGRFASALFAEMRGMGRLRQAAATVDWAVSEGMTTATFHIATPYPGTAFFRAIDGQGRLLHRDWDRYDTRRVVFEPGGMTPDALEAGYWRATSMPGRTCSAAHATAKRGSAASITSPMAPAGNAWNRYGVWSSVRAV